MKNLSANIQTLLDKSIVNFTYLLRIKSLKGIIALTNYNKSLDISVRSLTICDDEVVSFSNEYGLEISSIQYSSDGSIDTATAMCFPFENDIRYLTGGWYDKAFYDLYMVLNPEDVEVEPILLKKGELGNIRPQNSKYELELKSHANKFDQDLTRRDSIGCVARELGDKYCQVVLGDYEQAGSVTGLVSNRAFIDTAIVEADRYFMLGQLEWTSGNNQYLKVPIKNNVLSTKRIELYFDLPFDIQIGDDYKIWPGCQRRYQEDCIEKFNNAIHFQGDLVLLKDVEKLEEKGLV